jgi:ring-1,2-phenylacetyl-CoA epoxidase subunit PaaD
VSAGRGGVREAVARVVDPELRVVTIEELGILRDVSVAPDTGRVTVTIRPTYSGCPAMDAIRADIRAAARDAGHHDVQVRTVLAPPWSTDDISESGLAKLAAAGIAPPAAQRDPRRPPGSAVRLQLSVPSGRGGAAGANCPRCGSPDTEQLSRFGSTACKALWRCRSCAEPFEHVKAV